VDGQKLCLEAYYDPNTETIVINKDYLSNYPKSAVLLSHETLHAIWHEDYVAYQAGTPGHPQYGVPPDPPGGVRSANSIDQEYQAFLTMYQVYFDLKRNHDMPADTNLETNMSKFVNVNTGRPLANDSEAKSYLKSLYTDLPDY
jgi:hypothetical protein